jgi:hypothetical protein
MKCLVRASARASPGIRGLPVKDVSDDAADLDSSLSVLTGLYNVMLLVVRCPSDCSGHGLCYSSATLALQYGPDSLPGIGGDGVGPVYSNWEKDSMSNCMCDMGFTGPDCSQREFVCIEDGFALLWSLNSCWWQSCVRRTTTRLPLAKGIAPSRSKSAQLERH